MSKSSDPCASAANFTQLADALSVRPCVQGSVAVTAAPAVLDVMGGIGEDGGSLVLTTTVALSFQVAMWSAGGSDIVVQLAPEAGSGTLREYRVPAESVTGPGVTPEAILTSCREAGAEWTAPVLLTLREAASRKLFAGPMGGLAIHIQTDFPPDVDLGRHAVLAAATIEALCNLHSLTIDRMAKARLCCEAVLILTGIPGLRVALTALAGTADGSLLQIRCHPQTTCETLILPAGIALVAARTNLSRPTTHERLIETRACTAMGRRMIVDLRVGEGLNVDAQNEQLATITPTEYIEKYRDRLPSKITGKAFVAKFGTLRGLNGSLEPDDVYKVRSRAEHHIYENRRVHEFVDAIARARRSGPIEALTAAGELMYASHWSHSQRCGIGGVETDRLVNAIRTRGPAAGLFGAKVTGGGAGGELVVLMRDDEVARAAWPRRLMKRREHRTGRFRHIGVLCRGRNMTRRRE